MIHLESVMIQTQVPEKHHGSGWCWVSPEVISDIGMAVENDSR